MDIMVAGRSAKLSLTEHLVSLSLLPQLRLMGMNPR